MNVNAIPRPGPAAGARRGVPDSASEPAVTTLLAAAMQESQAPVVQVGDCVQRMLEALRRGLPREELDRVFARELALCVHGLQFHDRLMQQLSCVGALLSGPGAAPITAAPARFPHVEATEGSIELF